MTTGVRRKTLTALIHGPAKVGKSMLGASTPPPRLILDVELGSNFLPVNAHVMGNIRDPWPKPDGSWDTVIVEILSWDDAEYVLNKLQTRPHPFVSVSLDSLAALQNRLIFKVSGTDAVDRQDWGEILRLLQNFCEQLRDMTRHPKYPVDAVVVLCPTVGKEIEQSNGKTITHFGPHLRGQISTNSPYIFDVTGYLYTAHERQTGADGKSIKQVETRYLRTRRLPTIEAGERVQGRIPEVLKLPQISGTPQEVITKNNTFAKLIELVYKSVNMAPPAATEIAVVPEPPAVTPSPQEGK